MNSIRKSDRTAPISRREFVKTSVAIGCAAGLPNLVQAASASGPAPSLFPTDYPNKQWLQFRALGFRKPACGVIYRLGDQVTNGMALGGIDTGCLDLETSGLLGYMTIFNTHVPRRGPLNLPLFGLSVGGKTCVLCDPTQIKTGSGDYQPAGPGAKYRVWKGKKWENAREQFQEGAPQLRLDGVTVPRQIHYWGHYPIVELEFETDLPVSVGLRAWSSFLPGQVVDSMLPGIVFEVHLRNFSKLAQEGTIAISFPGPTDKEAGCSAFPRQPLQASSLKGMMVGGPMASFALGVVGNGRARFGGGLAGDGFKWSRIKQALPEPLAEEPGCSAAVDFHLRPKEARVERFILTWHAPTWNAGGYNWADSSHTFTHMYARHYPSALATAQKLARDHDGLLKRILAWQEVVYTYEALPVWLRDSLVNALYMITEDGLWAQAKAPLPSWVRAEDGLFGLNECPRGCPQIECIPCSFYGNQPLVYFFPELALSTYRGYKGYQFADGAPPWIFGGCTGNTAPIDFASTTRGYQFATNGISLAAMLDRYFLCYPERRKEFVREFYAVLKRCMIWTVNLRPEYPLGDRIIAMPTGNVGTEWFEAPEPGWAGMTAHVGGLHLAQLRITERFAEAAGDKAFAEQCREWLKAGCESMERKLWTGSYYLNYWEPETNRKSDLVFGYQLDGEWITDHHGLPSALPKNRVQQTLQTIKHCNVAVTKYGAVNYARADGTPAPVKGYGTYSYFPPEALMLAMNFMYEGQKDLGLELAHKVWHNLVCSQGYTWDMPNIMRGDVDTGERTYGNDYYQDMMLWSLPAALEGKDFGAPMRPGALVDRILRAARA